MGLASRAVRNIARRKARVLIAIVAIAVSMAVMVSIPAGLTATQSAMEGVNSQMTIDYAAQIAEIENTSSLIQVGDTGSTTSTGAGGRPSESSTSTINETVQADIASIDGIEAVVPYVYHTEGMPSRDDFFGGTPPTDGSGYSGGSFSGGMPTFDNMRNMLSNVTYVLGVSLTADDIANYSVLPTTILEGRNLEAGETGSVLLTYNLTEYYDTYVGGIITIEDTEFTVAGIYENTTIMGNRTVYMSIADAQAIYGMGTNVTYLNVYAEDSDMVSTIKSAIQLLYSDLTVTTMSDRLATLQALQEESAADLQSMATTLEQTENTATQEMIIAVVATGMIILFVMLYTVKERTKEIGVMKTLGFSKGKVIAQFILEGVIVSAIAAAVGAVIGWVGTSTLASILLPSSTTGTGGMNGAVASLSIQPDPASVLLAFLLVVAIGALGSLYPAWRASRTRPVEALKNE